jgi:transposase
MWNKETRERYKRSMSGYESDLTDEEWAQIEPLIPPAKRGGRPRKTSMRKVVDSLLYVLSTGCQWRAIPKDLAPKSTVYDYYDLWVYNGVLDRIHDVLYVRCRELEAREASPTAAVIDSQSVKGAEKGGAILIRRDLMRAKKSRARSGIFL